MDDLNELKNLQEEIETIVELITNTLIRVHKIGHTRFMPSTVWDLIRGLGYLGEAKEGLLELTMGDVCLTKKD